MLPREKRAKKALFQGIGGGNKKIAKLWNLATNVTSIDVCSKIIKKILKYFQKVLDKSSKMCYYISVISNLYF